MSRSLFDSDVPHPEPSSLTAFAANDLIRDNVFVGTAKIGWDGTGSIANDHNLNAGGPGVGNRKGMPVFVGGTKPTSYAGYRLAPRSPGKGSASNGGDMGIRPPG